MDFNNNHSLVILIISISASFLAQFFKIFINFIRFKKLDIGLFFRTGGLPSSHRSMASAMACTIGLIEGFKSSIFALSVCFALIVMYDASGVRRAVGIQAGILNQMIHEMSEENPQFPIKRIKEFIGHTPFEVIVGSLFGTFMGYLGYYCFIKH